MRMSRKIWLALAVAALVAVSFAASVVATKRATEPRTKYTTHALDYLHSRQDRRRVRPPPEHRLGHPGHGRQARAAGIERVEGQGQQLLHVPSDLPISSAGASNGVENAPVYYSRLIMAYVASRNSDQVATAGEQERESAHRTVEVPGHHGHVRRTRAPSRRCPGTHELRDPHSRAGRSSPCTASRTTPPPIRTSWPHEAWLASQQNDDRRRRTAASPAASQGQPGNVLDTALAIQALTAGSERARLGSGPRQGLPADTPEQRRRVLVRQSDREHADRRDLRGHPGDHRAGRRSPELEGDDEGESVHRA